MGISRQQHGWSECSVPVESIGGGTGGKQQTSKEATAMRTILIVGMTVAGIGLTGISAASAAPVNGAIIGDLAAATGHVTTVQHWRWGSYGGHYRWGSRGGHYRWGSYGGGHYRWGSRGWRRY
jgi:hypothetical protein